MAIPPGNKLIGQVGLVAAYNSLAEVYTQPKLINMLGLAVVKAPTVIPPPSTPKNIGVGALGVSVAYAVSGAVRISSLLGLAVVKYEPPTDLIARNLLSTAVVVDTAGNFNVSPIKNTQVGVCNFDISYKIDLVDALVLKNLAGFVVVKYHLPYKTTSLVNIEYGAEAELNIGDNS